MGASADLYFQTLEKTKEFFFKLNLDLLQESTDPWFYWKEMPTVIVISCKPSLL